MIIIIFPNLIFNFLIYILNYNSNLIKLINLSKLFTNIYKSLLSFILLNVNLNQQLYVFTLFTNPIINIIFKYLYCYFIL